MARNRWCAVIAFMLATVLLGAGCGGERIVKIKGKLLKNGEPLQVSADTYVTLSFNPDLAPEDKEQAAKATARPAKFDHATGSYTVELPAGAYRTMLIIAPPTKPGQLSAPPRPIRSEKPYELTKDQELNIEVPAR